MKKIFLLPFLLLLFVEMSVGQALFAWSLMGVAAAGIGMSVMHDACHGAYSPNPLVNRVIGTASINMIGGMVFNWKLQHNKLHHTAYPTHEASGVIYAYLGPREKTPLFPNYE